MPPGGETARSEVHTPRTFVETPRTFVDTPRSELPTARTNLETARGYLDTTRSFADSNKHLIYNIPRTPRPGNAVPEYDGGVFGMMSPMRMPASNRLADYDASAFTSVVTPRVDHTASDNVTPHHLSMPLQFNNFSKQSAGHMRQVTIVGETPRPLNAQALESVLVSVGDVYPPLPQRSRSSAGGGPELSSRHLGARTHESGFTQPLPTFNMLPANAFMLRYASDTAMYTQQNTPREMETVLVSEIFPPAPCSSYPSSARGPSPSISGGTRHGSPV